MLTIIRFVMVDMFVFQGISKHAFYVMFDTDCEYTMETSPRETVNLLEDGKCSGKWGFSISSAKHIVATVIYKMYSV